MPSADRPARARAGAQAEALAARFLESHGLAIVARNVRYRMGEIDLVAREGATIVFVEVRLRRRSDFGGAAESITAAKRARIRAAAGLYLSRLPRLPACRIDAVLLDSLDPTRIRWVKDIDAN
jgi:putative endonuclease